MGLGNSNQFRTFQTPDNYEAALLRHAQKVRWLKAFTCPCISSDTGQPNPSCSLCKGRGKIYKNPTIFRDYLENVNHTSSGLIILDKQAIPESVKVSRNGNPIEIDSIEGNKIWIKPPFPKSWECIQVEYAWTNIKECKNENSIVLGTNLLKVKSFIQVRDRVFPISLESVSRVYNKTKDEVLTVKDFVKDYIYLQSMGSWTVGDVLEVDYTYVEPFDFLLVGVTGRIRYEQPYVLEDADVVLVTPYWCTVGANDLITALSVDRAIDTVVHDQSTVHSFRNYFDIERIDSIFDITKKEYTEPDFFLYDRNSIKWNITVPSAYTVRFIYHPTYIALTNLQTVRSAENKRFANRISLKLFDILTDKVSF